MKLNDLNKIIKIIPKFSKELFLIRNGLYRMHRFLANINMLILLQINPSLNTGVSSLTNQMFRVSGFISRKARKVLKKTTFVCHILHYTV
jgi:hypothetical protein